MKVEIKNAMFGDCSVLFNDKKTEMLIIDCGSRNKGSEKSSANYAYSLINNYFNSNNEKNISIMISHFDTDHFNGFTKIPAADWNKINKVYLPKITISKASKIVEVVLTSMLIRKVKPRSGKFSKSMMELLSVLASLPPNKIEYVSRGDNFKCQSENMKILWPKLHDEHDSENTIISNLTSIVIGEIDFENTSSGKTASILTTIKNELPSDIVGDMYQEIQVFATYITKKFIISLLSFLCPHEISNEEERNAIKIETSEKWFLTLLSSVELKFSSATTSKALSKLQSSLINDMNDTSIVAEFSNDKSIFLGDVSPEIIQCMHVSSDFCDRGISKKYKVVKIQHHGTRSYFDKNTPKGVYGVISNGGWAKTPVFESFITEPLFDSIICTNAHTNPKKYCTILKCSSCKCKCIKKGYEIKI